MLTLALLLNQKSFAFDEKPINLKFRNELSFEYGIGQQTFTFYYTLVNGQSSDGYAFTYRNIGPLMQKRVNNQGLYEPVTSYITDYVYSPSAQCYSGEIKLKSFNERPDEKFPIEKALQLMAVDVEVLPLN